MGKLPVLRRDELESHGQKLWDRMISAKGDGIRTGDDVLVGPLNAWVTAPRLGARIAELWIAFANETVLEPRLREVAILSTAAHWRGEWEWWSHSNTARSVGVSEAIIADLAEGGNPSFKADDERIVHDVARQLAAEGRVRPATDIEAHEVLGDRAVVELVSLCGFYTLVSFTINVFDPDLPAGVEPTWPTS